MIALLKTTWALLLGVALIMAGNALQGSLLGLRGSLEGFSSTLMGMVMSGYYVGFLLSSLTTPKVVRSVGHVRVFAALAAMAATSILVASIFISPYVWFLTRAATGFCYAGLYVIAESWINDRSTNETRGRLLSVYMVVQFAGLTSGQALLNLADPAGFQLFSLVAIVISLAVVPILLTAKHAPAFAEPSHVSLVQLYRISPLGAIGTLGVGMAHSGFFQMGAVFGHRIGLGTAQVSIYMMSAVFGGVALQWPLGRLSDRFDRRRVLTLVTFAAALIAIGAIAVSTVSLTALSVAAFLYAGMSLPMYSLCISHTNDFLKPDQMVAASGTLLLLFGIGAIGGPLTVGAFMGSFGPQAYWAYLVVVHALLGLFALYRMTRRAARPIAEQGRFVAMPPNPSPTAASMAQHPPSERSASQD
jgi:MFS family permease